ncbi:M48 family metalloprotease [Bartonella raoultii]|uniref:M48 family metalloprotease n=1 Tax=Bartonella raoultii TaxID=1457020 RepID=A0ABS7I8V2_9HYPH|nr:M48 family metalloprotease [Bartonella raoultii]MBX4335857.1 M48 family metalloprotease [Bartonella raoultii]
MQLNNQVHKRQKLQIFQRIFFFRRKIYSIPLLSFMLVLSACHNTSFAPNDQRFSWKPTKRIKRPHKSTLFFPPNATQHARILQIYGGTYHDPKLEKLLANILRKLIVVSHNSHKNYSITILNSGGVNAFALPNGSIYITRGMLALANDSSEVAAILAHELAHIIANHGILRLQKKAQLKTARHLSSHLLSHANRKLYNPIKDKQQLAQFSRNQELEADSIALELLQQAGYDPFASPRFLKSMEAYNAFCNISGITNASLDFLASHPTTPQRIHLAIEKARKIHTTNLQKSDHDFFLKNLDGMVFGGSLHTGFMRGNQFIHPQLGIAFSLPDNFTIEHSTNTLWASGPNNIAIRFDALLHPAEISASDYLQSGWIVGLDQSSIRPFTMHGLPGARARASNEKWQFDVVVIIFNHHIFRFLTAAPHHSSTFKAIAESTIQSFHPLSASQLQKLQPFKIRVVRVQKGDSVASLAKKMQNTMHKERLFRILNALSPTQTLPIGANVKIIME